MFIGSVVIGTYIESPAKGNGYNITIVIMIDYKFLIQSCVHNLSLLNTIGGGPYTLFAILYITPFFFCNNNSNSIIRIRACCTVCVTQKYKLI